ncbi:MAG: cell division protein FtsL [Acidobacteriota bacterium]
MVRKRFNRHQIILGFGLTILVVAFLSFYIWHLTESIRIGYEINRLHHRREELLKQVEKLETRKVSLLRLERIEKIATNKLHLKKAESAQIILSPNKNWEEIESP